MTSRNPEDTSGVPARLCVICKISIEGRSPKAITCSLKCYRVKKYARPDKVAGPGEKKCARTQCDRASGENKKYCSAYCYGTYKQAIKAGTAHLEDTSIRKCIVCKGSMENRANSARTCSEECFNIRKYKGDSILAENDDPKCERPNCLYTTKTRSKNAKYCSGYCKTTHVQELEKAAREDKPCAREGCTELAIRFGGAKYCSRKCNNISSNGTGTARRYGLKQNELEYVEAWCSGKCWVCSLTTDGRVVQEGNHTDHDHSTLKGAGGHIRGKLCGKCNTGLGVLDDKDFMAKAITYLAGGVLKLSKADPADLRVSPTAMRSHGVSLKQHADLEAKFGGCWICLKPEVVRDKKGNTRKLCVDHDHSLGKGLHAVRGLLCMMDNQRLHYLEDAVWLKAANTYLLTGAAKVDELLAEVRAVPAEGVVLV